MTMDSTLKSHGGLKRARSVLTRAERIARLVEEEKFDPETTSPLGLPKIKVRHSRAGTKIKKEQPVAGAAGAAEGAVETPAEPEAKAKVKAKTAR